MRFFLAIFILLILTFSADAAVRYVKADVVLVKDAKICGGFAGREQDT